MPGSGIAPPRLLREVKADYTEDARKRGISGDVVLEIVVRRDGSVGDIRILKGLAGGLNNNLFRKLLLEMRQWQQQGVEVVEGQVEERGPVRRGHDHGPRLQRARQRAAHDTPG